MKLKKSKEWDTKLFDFINKVKERPFKWGKWDCCIFGISALESMTDELPLKSHWKNKKEAMDFIDSEGGTLNKIASKYLKDWGLDVIDKMFITAGDICIVKEEQTGEDIIGVCTGNMIACVCEEGFTFKGNLNAKKVWRVRSV